MAPETNPFRFGALALDDAFADRDAEVAELASDIRNGQDVVVFAPRRWGKSSLVWRAAGRLAAERVMVAQVDLMTTPSKESLAAALAGSIYENIASPLERARERALAPFRGLRIQPTINVNPEDGSFSFAFEFGRAGPDIDATLERLLELPAELGGARGRRAALVIDEFQEIVELDPGLPKLLRAVFQRQPEVAHVYLGSKRHVMARIFDDVNEPFWRSAKTIDLGPIPAEPFAAFIVDRFRADEEEGRGGCARQGAGSDRRPSLRDPGALLLPLGADPGRRGGDSGATAGGAGGGAALRARPLQPPLGKRVGRPEARPRGARS